MDDINLKTVFLLSHFPDQRFMKRIRIALISGQVNLIFSQRKNNPYSSSQLHNLLKKEYIHIKKDKSNRLLTFIGYLQFSLKELRILKPNKIHLGNLDMLIVAYFYKKVFDRNVEIIYEVADLHKIVMNESNRKSKKIIKRVLMLVENRLLKSVSFLVLTSPYFWKDYYQGKIEKEKYLFIPNVPEKKYFSSVTSPNFTKVKIGFIGLVRYKKQLSILLEASKNFNIDVLIAGDGPDKEELESAYASEKVKFEGQYDYYKDVGKLYNSVNLIFAVYDTNLVNVRIALPNKLYEAIVSERPIIVAKGTKLWEIVKELGIGYSVNSNSSEELSALLEYISKNPQDLVQKSKQCKNIKEEYFFDNYFEVISKLYANK